MYIVPCINDLMNESRQRNVEMDGYLMPDEMPIGLGGQCS
jgi:hypothetical protein